MQRKISKLTEELNLMKAEVKKLKKELNKEEERTVSNCLFIILITNVH